MPNCTLRNTYGYKVGKLVSAIDTATYPASDFQFGGDDPYYFLNNNSPFSGGTIFPLIYQGLCAGPDSGFILSGDLPTAFSFTNDNSTGRETAFEGYAIYANSKLQFLACGSQVESNSNLYYIASNGGKNQLASSIGAITAFSDYIESLNGSDGYSAYVYSTSEVNQSPGIVLFLVNNQSTPYKLYFLFVFNGVIFNQSNTPTTHSAFNSSGDSLPALPQLIPQSTYNEAVLPDASFANPAKYGRFYVDAESAINFLIDFEDITFTGPLSDLGGIIYAVNSGGKWLLQAFDADSENRVFVSEPDFSAYDVYDIDYGDYAPYYNPNSASGHNFAAINSSGKLYATLQDVNSNVTLNELTSVPIAPTTKSWIPNVPLYSLPFKLRKFRGIK